MATTRLHIERTMMTLLSGCTLPYWTSLALRSH